MSNELLWAGEFGDEYRSRNEAFPYASRFKFFKAIIEDHIIKSILEVGCNTGFNLRMMSDWISSTRNIWGCDVNYNDIIKMREQYPNIQSVYASGFNLPFRDDYFDLVFTSGVLIHQKPSEVESMMQEIIRVSSKYVMAIEYFNEYFVELAYQGGRGTAFKGPYGDIYEKRYGLRMRESGFLDLDEGFDRCHWWLLEKK